MRPVLLKPGRRSPRTIRLYSTRNCTTQTLRFRGDFGWSDAELHGRGVEEQILALISYIKALGPQPGTRSAQFWRRSHGVRNAKRNWRARRYIERRFAGGEALT